MSSSAIRPMSGRNGFPPYKPYFQQALQDVSTAVADLYVYFYELALKVLRPGGRFSLRRHEQMDEGRLWRAAAGVSSPRRCVG